MADAEAAPDWRAVFGHDEPYPEQADGVEAAIEAGEEGGFAVVEGACGTGKTMLALTAGIDRVRDPDSPFERVFVLTSVKQQLRQFEEDLETINENLPADWNPVSGLTLVGKADVCPYARERTADVTPESVYERCEGLRERTRNLAEESGAGALAEEARRAQTGLLDSGGDGATYLETAGEPTPYLPETPERGDAEFCPFYAGFLDDLPEDGDPLEAVPFDPTEFGLIDAEELVRLAAGAGSCPHSVMGAVLPHVEVVVGNYYHAFDPQTVATFTGALCDDSTFVVCDEAHMLEPRVRELVSDGVADASLRDAANELTRVIQPLRFEDEGGHVADAETVRAELQDAELGLDELVATRDLISDLRDELSDRIESYLDAERQGWRADVETLEDDEIPLRDPSTPGRDDITAWAAETDHTEDVWVRAEAVGHTVAHVLNVVEEEDKQRAAPAVGRTLAAWRRRDHEQYYREISLSRRFDRAEPPDSWRRAYSARLELHNCVPGDAIAERLDAFGGGVLMSATLEPTEVFRRVTGLDALESDGRPVVERTYGLTFPESNRASFAVDAPAFTYENRGATDEDNRTRLAYVDAAARVARRGGNVLVGMPNYAEARWMADELSERLDVPVLTDEASDDAATESLKSDFFAGDDKVLVTSLRGTLTEGVDYRGDRLSAAVVCGVPLIDTSQPLTRAVVAAYDRTFDDGFETALTVPAVRKARQAVGRVIRGPDERGVRVLLDRRYARDVWNGVREYLPAWEREEFTPVSTDMLDVALDRFESR